MKKFLLLSFYLLFFFLLFSFVATAQKPDSVQKFIDSAVTIMQRHSVFSSKVNWKKVKDSVAFLSKDAKTYGETVAALSFAFNKLGDNHGWLVIEGNDYRNRAVSKRPSGINEKMKLAASKGPKIYAARVKDKYAYLSIPFFNDQTKEGTNAFAQRLQDSLCRVVTKNTKGLILDLRLNAGGFTQAMVVGVSNVFGNQAPSAGKHYVGDWHIENYGIFINDTFRIALKSHCGDYSKLPVAILIGPQTASAGEFLALGFTARSKTVLIGEPTAGYTSANNGFLLPGKNNGIVLAEDYAVDKTGKVYTDGISPSIEIIGGDDFFDHEKDKKIAAAVKWLGKQAN
ncbi:MAG TPA: S41 family peptidase [Flavisolibacter sp.]|jgi:C-terminal processing protease CtpA/Prc|nr:S41 family peptidase [Flavisolibacter sp.]